MAALGDMSEFLAFASNSFWTQKGMRLMRTPFTVF